MGNNIHKKLEGKCPTDIKHTDLIFQRLANHCSVEDIKEAFGFELSTLPSLFTDEGHMRPVAKSSLATHLLK